jgi:uncharacterized protein YggU (UPF0235/DUF167 family)
MKFLEKISETSYFVRLNVKTDSKKQKIVNDNDFLTIFLKSKPIQNKANKELLNLIKRRLKISMDQIQIISGLKSHDKLIKLDFLETIEEREILRKLIF